MRKKPLKTMSLALAVAVAASGLNPGMVSYAAPKEDQQVVESSDKDSKEETKSKADEVQADADSEEVDVSEPAVFERFDFEHQDEKAEKEEQPEGKLPEMQSTDDAIADYVASLLGKEEESIELNAGTAADTTKLSNVGMNAYLLEYVASVVGKDKNSITVGDLKKYEDPINLRGYENASKITSIEGLQYAVKINELNLAGTAVKEIPDRMFAGNDKLTSITLPDTVKKIGKSAFEECIRLESINTFKNGTVIPNTLPALTEAGQQSFKRTNITSITFDSDETTDKQGIAYQNATSMFASCPNLESVQIGNFVAYIPTAMFMSSGSEKYGMNVAFGSRITKIGSLAFNDVNFAESAINLSKCGSLEEIGESAFLGANGFSTVILPNRKAENASQKLVIKDAAFSKSSISKMYSGDTTSSVVSIPAYVTSIGQSAFSLCSEITEVEIPAGIKTIEDYLFDQDKNLQTVKIAANSNIESIGDCSFRYTAISNTDFLANLTKLKVIGKQHLSELKIEQGVGRNPEVGDQYYENLGGASLPFGGFNGIPIEIDENGQKTFIDSYHTEYPCGSETFSDCFNLTSVTIPSNVTSIGSRAFYVNIQKTINPSDLDRDGYGDLINTPREAKITSIKWNSGGTPAKRVIYPGAFMGNKNLEKIVLPDNAGDTLEIGNYAFTACGSFDYEVQDNRRRPEGLDDSKELTINGNNVLPKSVSRIGECAFYRCMGLKSITIQPTSNNSCPTFGEGTFQDCIFMSSATIPDSVTNIPNHMFYNDPLENCPISSKSVNLNKIGILAFMGNQFKTVDLSGCTKLTEIGSGSLAYGDAVAEQNYSDSVCSKIKYDADEIEEVRTHSLKTLIVPNKLEGNRTMYLGAALVAGQLDFDTIKTPNRANGDGVIFIPQYMIQGEQQGLFYYSGVEKTVWENDTVTNKVNLWKTIPQGMYEECQNIVSTKDVLPAGDYLENIGKLAFDQCLYLEEADLSRYVNLKQISRAEDNVLGFYEFTGAFANCLSLSEIYLPYTTSGDLRVQEGSFGRSVSVAGQAPMKVCLGNVQFVGERAFFGNEAMVDTCYVDDANKKSYAEGNKSVLKTTSKFVLPKSLKNIGIESFKKCSSIDSLQIDGLETMGYNCFSECTNITEVSFPTTLHEIADGAFSSCGAISNITFRGQEVILRDAFRDAISDSCEIVFDASLKEIQGSAFEGAGTANYDFSKAKNLTTIGESAFKSNKNLTSFVLEETKVERVVGILQECSSLESVAFGPEVKYIGAGTVTRAGNLSLLKISPATTIDKEMFKGTSAYGEDIPDAPTATNTGLTVQITDPEPVVVPVKQYTYLPYAINKAGESSFHTILVGGKNDLNNPDIQNLMKITGNIGGAYWGSRTVDENGTYEIKQNFVNTAVTRTIQSGVLFPQEETVDAIRLDGLKAGKTTITLEAALNLVVEVDGDYSATKTIKTNPFNVVYNVSVEPVKVYADLKCEDQYTKLNLKSGATHNFFATYMNSGNVTINYSIRSSNPAVPTAIDTHDIVVKTDNPAVLVPKIDYSSEYDAKNGCVVKVTEPDGTFYEYATNFILSAKKPGTAKITVYPVGHPDCAQVYTFVVDVDVSDVELTLPEKLSELSYGTGLPKGTTFNALSSYTNVLGAVYKAGDKTHCSNRIKTMTYSSSAPQYVTVDKTGKVTVVKEFPDGVNEVTIKGVLKNSTGDVVERTLAIRVKEANATLNAAVKDTDGVTYVPVVEPKNGQPGEVTYRLPAADQTSVQIPDEVTIKNNTYKVTKIDPSAFQNKKKIDSVTIGNNIKTIPANAFKGCTGLTSVTIPDSVTSIGSKAFYGCKKLNTVSINTTSKLTSIGNSAFQKCSKLPSIMIPKKVKTIGTNTFNGCKKLDSIVVYSTVLKKVGKKSLKSTKKTLVIQVPKKKYKKYKKLFKGKGQNKKAKIVKG